MQSVLLDGDSCFLRTDSAAAGVAREALSRMRKAVSVRAVLESGTSRGLIPRRSELVTAFGFSLSEIQVLQRKAVAPGDLFLTTNTLALRAWKDRHPLGCALLWHAPSNFSRADDGTWTRVCDWRVVEWFALGRSCLAVCS